MACSEEEKHQEAAGYTDPPVKRHLATGRNHDDGGPIGTMNKAPAVRMVRDAEVCVEDVKLDWKGNYEKCERHDEQTQEPGFIHVGAG